MIEIKNISMSFDDKKVLDDISCNISDGTIFGVVGSNGAGKSTLFRMMSGVYDKKSGEILYDGVDLGNKLNVAPEILFLSDEAYFESPDTIDMVAKRYKAYYKNFDNKKYLRMLKAYRLEKAMRMIKLSKGMKKQAFLSIALACNAKYLFLDETLDGLDPLMRINTKKVIFDEALNRSMITIIASHSLKELEDICDSLAILHDGKMIVQGAIDDIKIGLTKVRCAFNEEMTEDDFANLDILHFDRSGKIYTIVADDDESIVKKEIDKFNPILVEVLPITIEEVFVIRLQQLGYGVQNFMEDE